MDLIKCPVCGEMYSSSYPHCPFCEEDGDSGRKVKYKPKRRVANRQKALSARGGMVVVLVLVLALLSWYLFGDNIIHRGEQPTPEQEDPHSGTEQAVPAGPSKLTDDPEPSGGGENVTDPVQTTDPVTVTDPEPVTPPVDTNVDVSGAKLNRDDFTLSYAGEKFTIKLSGTTATPTWSIDNANVASIGTDGTVTAIANGNTTVHCKVGSRDLTCTVRMRGTGQTAAKADRMRANRAGLLHLFFTKKVSNIAKRRKVFRSILPSIVTAAALLFSDISQSPFDSRAHPHGSSVFSIFFVQIVHVPCGQ